MARPISTSKTRGAALLLALSLLILFSMLGTAYLRYMALERHEAQIELEAIHARQLAERGVWAAIGKLSKAQTANAAPVLEAYALDLPVYEGLKKGDLVPHGKYSGKVEITLEDESAKINLNHVPTRVLQAALGVDGNTARAIKGALPRQGEAPTVQRHWLGSTRDLVTRGLVEAKVLDHVDPSLLTVYSVSPAQGPTQFINTNTAPPAVLAAVLGIDAPTAQAVAAVRGQKPFSTVAELTAAAGVGVDQFNITGPSSAPDRLPLELSFTSRSFRVQALAKLDDGGGKPCAEYFAEAVVVFDTAGKPAITHWRETSKTQQ